VSKTWRGATAKIEQRPVTACIPADGDSFSVAYAMLGNTYSGDPNKGFAAIGYWRNDAETGCHCERYFWEWSFNGFNAVRALWGNPVAEAHVKFRVDWQVGDGKIHLFYDPQLDGWDVPPDNQNGEDPVADFNPADWTWQVPIFGEEIQYQQSSYKGTLGDRTDFTEMQMRESGGGTNWISTDVVGAPGAWDWVSDLSNKGFHDEPSNPHIRIWN
jgi:hypothetical protein